MTVSRTVSRMFSYAPCPAPCPHRVRACPAMFYRGHARTVSRSPLLKRGTDGHAGRAWGVGRSFSERIARPVHPVAVLNRNNFPSPLCRGLSECFLGPPPRPSRPSVRAAASWRTKSAGVCRIPRVSNFAAVRNSLGHGLAILAGEAPILPPSGGTSETAVDPAARPCTRVFFVCTGLGN